jgi:hypothetical protein
MGNQRDVGRRPKADIERHTSDPPPAPREMVPTPADRLDYIAEMVLELKEMSVRAECPELAKLLTLAYREAVKQRRAITLRTSG